MQVLRVPIGAQLRSWRERRQLGQLELLLVATVSARHLSFVENGRAQPGRDLILRLAKELDVALRDRNALLVSAGFAPVFGHRRFDDPAFDPVRAIMLEKQRRSLYLLCKARTAISSLMDPWLFPRSRASCLLQVTC